MTVKLYDPVPFSGHFDSHNLTIFKNHNLALLGSAVGTSEDAGLAGFRKKNCLQEEACVTLP